MGNTSEYVNECFEFHRRRYGSKRIAAELKIGRYLVRRLMREQDLKAIQPKSFVPKTTNSGHGGRISPNLLKENEVKICEKGQAIVGDIKQQKLCGIMKVEQGCEPVHR